MRKAIEPILRDNLLRLARAYLAARIKTVKNVSLTSVSRNANGDPPFFANLEAGKCSFTIRAYDKMIDWFDENWPKGEKRPTLLDPRHGPMRRKPKPKRTPPR